MLLFSSCKEIIDIVRCLKNGTSAGYDDINITVVKKTIHLICVPLCSIFNSCLSTGIFPNQMKIAKVIPVFKSGDRTNVHKYRPISVLPIFSKKFEKCLYKRLRTFLTSCNILSENQHGFRMRHSTTTALLNFVDKVSYAIDSRQFTIGLFLDLSKAFDTLDLVILLRKLEAYGIRGILLQLFKDYLSNRQQFVSIQNQQSSHLPIRCGVPHGSILGPLLFLNLY